MADQHQGIYDFVERLLPLLQLLGQNPDSLAQVGGEMCSLTSALDEIFRAHLELEEAGDLPRHPRIPARECPRRNAGRNAAAAEAGLVVSA